KAASPHSYPQNLWVSVVNFRKALCGGTLEIFTSAVS
ncbi:MAG: hypothetical protein ACI9HX_000834, partial [Pseudoalteromonas tetraodonis]